MTREEHKQYARQRTADLNRLAAHICLRFEGERFSKLSPTQQGHYRTIAMAAREYLRDKEGWRPTGGALRWRREQ